ncbi:aldehyde dehydrogenase family protein, partial [Vibrio parahaemolyticus]
KRITQELGGKSPNIILADADLATAVSRGVERCFGNSGQSCNAPTRMLVPEAHYEEVARLAKQAAATAVVGNPLDPATTHGPVS